MLVALPHPIRILLLVVTGALIGSFINWAIYSWAYFLKRPISPWMTPDPQTSPRRWLDRVPIAGWILLRRDQAIHGKGFWIRPLLIEIVWAVGLPWFYYWQCSGGLTGGPATPTPPITWNLQVETWFFAHTILIALMFIATFIDFDERTIPDFVTIPGTLIALMIAAGCPWLRLPNKAVANLAGMTFDPIHYASSQPLPGWHLGLPGLIIAIAIFTVWILALLPKICTLRYGVIKGLKFMVASVIRPKRKTICSLRKTPRRPDSITVALGLLWIIGCVAILLSWQMLVPPNWLSLFGSLIGMGFGGGMIWAIRIVARYAMGREAMGFGDVTLMAMIGAFLGWQATLLTFAIAPFAALLIVAVCFIFTKDNELAFGPYLCFGCLVLLLGWPAIWPRMEFQFFFVGPWLFLILVGGLIAMAFMLLGIQWVKSKLFGVEQEEA
jgi:leader peptidase (prepilin peptidase)/N-methyltransferase